MGVSSILIFSLACTTAGFLSNWMRPTLLSSKNLCPILHYLGASWEKLVPTEAIFFKKKEARVCLLNSRYYLLNRGLLNLGSGVLLKWHCRSCTMLK